MHLNKGPNGTHNKLFAEAGVIAPDSTGRGQHGPANLGKETKTMVLVDPLRKGNGGCPLSVSPPDYFQNPMRAQGMERISFAGQHIGRGGEYIDCGPRAGSVHMDNLQD